MDAVLARLEHHVAEAADAWLTDPQDAGAYARLVAAVRARREHPSRAADTASDVQAGPRPVADSIDAEPIDEIARERPVVRLGAGLSSDPRKALEQLLGHRPDLDPTGTAAEPVAADGGGG